MRTVDIPLEPSCRQPVADCFNIFIADPIASMQVTDTGVIIEIQEHPDVPEYEYLTLERIAKAIITAHRRCAAARPPCVEGVTGP